MQTLASIGQVWRLWLLSDHNSGGWLWVSGQGSGQGNCQLSDSWESLSAGPRVHVWPSAAGTEQQGNEYFASATAHKQK